MDRSEKDKLERYGKLVWDFANSKTSDDILTSFFENLQSAFNFSRDFKERALKRYPTEQMIIGGLSGKEHELFQILLKQKDVMSLCNRFLNGSDLILDQYDPIDSMFRMSKILYMDKRDGIGPYRGESFLIPGKDIDEYIDNHKITNEYWDDDIKLRLKTLARLHHQAEGINSEKDSRFAEIEKIALDFEEISELHGYVYSTHRMLKGILMKMMASNNAYVTKGFQKILARYNKIQRTKCIINDDHELIETDPFNEDYFFSKGLPNYYDNPIFEELTGYCLIEFLKHPEYRGKERMAICQHCNGIFSKSKLNGLQIYCPNCSRKNKMTSERMKAYMKDYRKNPAHIKAMENKKREEKINHLMDNAGKTRKQAEIIVADEM